MLTPKLQEKQNEIFSCQRWIVLFTYSLISFANVLSFVSYTPIYSYAAIYYNIPDSDLQWLGNFYYIPLILFSHIFNKLLLWKFSLGLQISQLLSGVGSLIVWLGGSSFLLALIGYMFLGLGEAIFYSGCLYLTKLWFQSDERLQSTSVGAFANYAGVAFGYGFTSIYFDGITDQEEINVKIESMNKFIAIFNCATFGISIFTLIKQPDRENQQLMIRDTLFQSYKKVLQNEEYVFDVLSIGYFLGLGWYYLTLVSLQLYPYGYTQQQIFITGTIVSASGVIVGLYASYKLDQQTMKGFQPDYDKTLRILFSLGFWALIIEALFIENLPYGLLLILNFFIGVGLNGAYPIMLEALMEKFYPIHELVLVSIVSSIACMISLIMNGLLLLTVFIDYGLWIACFFLIPPYGYLLIRYNTQYKRFEQES